MTDETTPPAIEQHPFTMRELLEKMLRGWVLYESEQATSEQEKQPSPELEEVMTRICGGNQLEGHLLTLFGHWSNDIISMAAHYGLALARRQPNGDLLHDDGTVDTLLKGGKLEIVEIEPAPSLDHYWYKGQWNAPDPDGKDFAVFHVAGEV